MTAMTATSVEPATTTPPCPEWCDRDTRQDQSTDPKTHPEDFVTWHRSEERLVEVVRPTSISQVTVALELYDPDLKEPADPGPEIEVHGDDGSGSVCGLSLPMDAAEAVALHILQMVQAVRA